MQEMRTIQWFPGHMAKTRRLIQDNLSLVDAVVEILDARIPDARENQECSCITRPTWQMTRLLPNGLNITSHREL